MPNFKAFYLVFKKTEKKRKKKKESPPSRGLITSPLQFPPVATNYTYKNTFFPGVPNSKKLTAVSTANPYSKNLYPKWPIYAKQYFLHKTKISAQTELTTL